MRTVAVALLALSSVLVMLPLTGATNECTISAAQAQACLAVPVAKPILPPPAPGVPPQLDPYFDVYYVIASGAACAGSPLSAACRGGVPPAAGSGVPLPTGGGFGPGVFGVVWQESNACGGLQRTAVGGCGLADKMILV